MYLDLSSFDRPDESKYDTKTLEHVGGTACIFAGYLWRQGVVATQCLRTRRDRDGCRQDLSSQPGFTVVGNLKQGIFMVKLTMQKW